MKMYEQIGEFTPDSLIVSPDFPILKSGIGLKPGYGVLKRGSLIVKAADGSGYLAGSTETEAAETSVFGILTDDTDTGTDKTVTDNIPAVAYQTGEFNPEAVKVADGAAVGEFEDEMKKISIFLRAVQNY
ncbi:hypothetical protein D3Z36_00760 [Lachnospiraceae bacterium]|nr:hypothetical protein [Lachnospiraceae bacterium]